MTLGYGDARRVIDGALAAARSKQSQPLAIIVLDSGGHPIAFAREDGASLFRFDIARAKAVGALGMGSDTRAIAGRASSNQLFYTSLAIAIEGQIAFSPGGVLIKNQDGILVGSVGISGDTGDADEECAFSGIAVADLRHAGS